jgi:hypothetical protein
MNATRLLGHVLLGILGVLVACAGSLVQAAWAPLGLLLSLSGAAALFWGGALATRGKLGAVVPAATWALTVLILTTTRPEGDFLFAAGAGSYLFLFGGMLAAGLCAALAPTDRPMFDVTASGSSRGAARPGAGKR